MRKIQLIIASVVLLFGGMVASGCDEDLPISKSQHSNIGKSDLAKDPQKNGSSSMLKQNNAESEDSSVFLTIVLWVSVLASLATSLFTLAKYKDLNKRGEYIEEDIDFLKKNWKTIQVQAHRIKDIRPKQSTPTDIEYQMLSDRIAALERLVKQKNTEKPKGSKIQNDMAVNIVGVSRKGFFSSPTQCSETEAYFSNFIATKDSEARFSVEVRNDKAEFKPLEGQMSLNNIKSDDVMKLVLELKGCALREATRMEVIMHGEARLEEGNWIVTKKALVNLTR